MAKWKNVIDVADLWTAYHKEELSPGELAHKLAERIGDVNQYNLSDDSKARLQHIIDIFQAMDKEETDEWDFDSELMFLYDWADQGNQLWIKTF